MNATRFDVIVIGGGVNGLVAAATLGRAGRSVMVLEGRDVLGGIAAREEFHPGFHTPGLVHDTHGLRASVVQSLGLESHGLRWREVEPSSCAPRPDGPGVALHADESLTVAELRRVSPADAAAWPAWRDGVRRLSGFVQRVFDEAPPDVEADSLPALLALGRTALALRRLGVRDMTELLRVGPMCVADWLNEHFENEALKVALAVPTVAGTWMGPWSAGTAALLLLDQATRGRSVAGGPAAVTDALAHAARNAGAECRISTPVARIRLDGGRVRGVELEGGDALEASVVVATCDPRRTFGQLLGIRDVPDRLGRRIATLRTRGTTARLSLALREPLEYAGRPGEPVERAFLAESLDGIERSFDAVKYGRMSDTPTLDVWQPSLHDAALAPDGAHVASILVHFAPHTLRDGWTDSSRETLTERVLTVLDRYAPGARERTIGYELLTPVDLEQRHGLTGGHVHHGEHALDQLLHLRPTPECGRYATPIGGLYLGGAGSHPGGGVTGAPGRLAAEAVLGR